ncbi:MAG: protocatechuate 3,4-dioxygenase subunit alpha, partial [Chloroflexota bacterium]
KIGMTYGDLNIMVNDETQGERIRIRGQVFDGNGKTVDDATIEIWQADANGIYNHPNDPSHSNADPAFFGFGRAETDDDGRYWFKTIKPGKVGDQAPHLVVRVFMRGMLLHANSRLYFSDEDNSMDEILSGVPAERQHTLIAQRNDIEGTPTYMFDVNMQGENELVFFEP